MITTAAWYVTINKARIDNYKNFYKSYDAEADFQRMKVHYGWRSMFGWMLVKYDVQIECQFFYRQLPHWDCHNYELPHCRTWACSSPAL